MTVPEIELCKWPGCYTPALCRSGNFGGEPVCGDHLRIINGISLPSLSGDPISDSSLPPLPPPGIESSLGFGMKRLAVLVLVVFLAHCATSGVKLVSDAPPPTPAATPTPAPVIPPMALGALLHSRPDPLHGTDVPTAEQCRSLLLYTPQEIGERVAGPEPKHLRGDGYQPQAEWEEAKRQETESARAKQAQCRAIYGK
jgi:hypothetical protein